MPSPTSDRPVHTPAFRRRRALNWLTLGVTYASMYMARYNLSFANKALSDTYGWDKTQVGTIITTALTIYGISALFNGPIADRIGGRKAMLIGVFPVIGPLNIMRLASPQSAILSAVIFNALIIIALIPLALRGVHFRPWSAGMMLRRNLLIYGLGGVALPFPGIKLIDMIVNMFHLA